MATTEKDLLEGTDPVLKDKANLLMEQIVKLRGDQFTKATAASAMSKEARAIDEEIDPLRVELEALMYRLNLREMYSADGKTHFAFELAISATKNSQPKLGGKFRDVAEAADWAEGEFNACPSATTFHNGAARDVLMEIAEGFGTKIFVLSVEALVSDLKDGVVHADQIGRLRQLCAAESKHTKKNGS